MGQIFVSSGPVFCFTGFVMLTDSDIIICVLYMFLCVPVYVYVQVSVYVFRYVCVCIGVCVQVCVCTDVYRCVCAGVHVCVCQHKCQDVCVGQRITFWTRSHLRQGVSWCFCSATFSRLGGLPDLRWSSCLHRPSHCRITDPTTAHIFYGFQGWNARLG